MPVRLIIVAVLITSFSLNICAQKSEDVLNYIATYKELAISEMKRTGVPAAIKLAQGIHETDAGKSNLVTRSNNHFGIKCKTSWVGDKVFHDDDARGECFRSYTRPIDSYMDHSDFLKNGQRYAFLFSLDPTDYEGWAYGLKKAGYATNVRYSQVLIRLIREYNLQDFTLIALGRIKESDQMLASNTTLLPKLSLTDPVKETPPVAPSYPAGQFIINKTKVIYVDSNTAWLSLAQQYRIPLTRLWDFNDLEKDDDVLRKAQLVFLQRKRKVGEVEFHVVKPGESLYDISQSEGVRLESLQEYNHLDGDMEPAVGEKLHLQYAALKSPRLNNEKRTTTAMTPPPAASYQGAAAVVPAESQTDPSPVSTTHLVSTRETLYSISRKYGVEQEKIREWNRLNDLNLRIGQALIIYTNN